MEMNIFSQRRKVGNNRVQQEMIGCNLLQMATLLDFFDNNLMEQYSNIKDIDFEKIADNSHGLNIQKLQLQTVAVTPRGMTALSLGRWNSLIFLELKCWLPKREMGQKGCKYLSRMFLPQIKQLTLSFNGFETPNICHLSKSQWKTLIKLNLKYNLMSTGSMKHLVRADWPNMAELNLNNNGMTMEELSYLLLSQNIWLETYKEHNVYYGYRYIRLRNALQNKYETMK